MIRIAKNLIYNKASRRIREHAFQVYHVRTTESYSNVTQEELNLLSTEKVLSQLIEKLPFMQKKVFTLSRLNGLSNQDIADRLQLSDSTVKNHIHLALKSLKEQFLKHHLYFTFFLLEILF
jgi:RNA polymerase sigma-70 factor, ECF subfamily